MDSSVGNELNQSLKFSSLNAVGILYTTTITKTITSNHSNACNTYTHTTLNANYAVRNFSFNKNRQLQKISDKLSCFAFKTIHFLFYTFVILMLTNGFKLETVIAINDFQLKPEIFNITTVSTPLLLAPVPSSQLPVQALVFQRRHKNGELNHGSSSSNQTSNSSGNILFSSDTVAAGPTSSHKNNNNNSIIIIKGSTTILPILLLPPPPSLPSSSSAYLNNENLSATFHAPTTTTTFEPDPLSASSVTIVEFTMPAVHTVFVCIILLFVILGTIVGNVLVCIAVCMVRKLRRPCNYLLVSLALSDLCVAVLVMPMALLYEVLEEWNFGPVLCDIWVSFDVLCCTASILNLCAISVDRYLAITKPLEYGVKRTPRRMMLCVALVWLAAACISLPPLLILGNEHVDENGHPMCSVCQNFAYQIYATLGSFYIPLAVMLFVYYQIFRAARRIVLEEKRAQTHLQHALNGTGSPTGQTELHANIDQHRHSSYGNASLNYSTCGGLSASQGGSGGGGGGSGGAGGGSVSGGLLGSPHQKKLRFQLAKEKKASTTLGIIMSAFTICWLPFFILALIRPFVENETTHVPQSLSSLFLWLGYANSLLNPIIYATLNRDFRKPFQEILYFRCSSLNTMMRENYYHDQYGEPPSQRVMLGDERHGARESFL